ncbi:DUF6299 family protein [Streptomyces sp. NPDC059534]|uniref:DUF6299 family protein n=1 Tax=Streptomyces sp. NPDC059534 TaxID=3346859 RepID=UPI0036B4109E
MRVRLALTAAGLLAAVTAATAPLAHAGGADGLSVDGFGLVAADSTVTLSGTYRCLDDSAGPVLVGSTLVQGSRSAGIGGTRAVCDGRLHTWVNTSVVKDPAYQPGTAHVRATLMQLTTGETGLPTPGFLATETSDVELYEG